MYFSPEGAGHLVGREIKYYLPSRGILRSDEWTQRTFGGRAEDRGSIRYGVARVQEGMQRGDRVTAAQQFTFVIDTPLSNPYFALQVSVDGYEIPHVEMLSLVNNFADENIMNNPYKLANLRLNIAALCAQFCMFADQLQYNNTTLGRGIGEALRNKVREAMQPLVNLATQFANDATSPVPQAVRAEFNRIVTEYVNQYTELYTSPEKIKRAGEYSKLLIDSFKRDDVMRPRILPSQDETNRAALSGLVTFFGSIYFLPAFLFEVVGLSLGATFAVPVVAGVGTAALMGVMFTTYNTDRLPSFLAESAQARVNGVNPGELNIFEAPIQVRLENGQNIEIEANTPLILSLSPIDEIMPAWVALASQNGARFLLRSDIAPDLSSRENALIVENGHFNVVNTNIDVTTLSGRTFQLYDGFEVYSDANERLSLYQVVNNPAYQDNTRFEISSGLLPPDLAQNVTDGRHAYLVLNGNRFSLVIS